MKYLLIFLTIYLAHCEVVSRNAKIQDMISKIHLADTLYDELIGKAQSKVESEL